MEYRATLTPEDDAIVVSFPDLPGANTFGSDEADALAHASDAMVTIIEAYIKDRRSVPTPRHKHGHPVRVPALLAAKIALHNEMLAQHVNGAELSRRLKVHRPQVDRLVNVRHGSRIDQLEAAFGVLGKRLEVSLVDDRPQTRPYGMRRAVARARKR